MLKVINETPAKIWISDFCFVPGESEVKYMSKGQEEEIKRICENNSTIKEAIEEKKLVFQWDEVKEVKEVKKGK